MQKHEAGIDKPKPIKPVKPIKRPKPTKPPKGR